VGRPRPSPGHWDHLFDELQRSVAEIEGLLVLLVVRLLVLLLLDLHDPGGQGGDDEVEEGETNPAAR
jgi:hypothetical protein